MARERERKRLYEFWMYGERWPGTPVESYYAGRGLILPPNARLTFAARGTRGLMQVAQNEP